MSDLDDQLLKAHAKGDVSELVRLYTKAADCTLEEQAKRFFLTHAYVFALETDHPDTPMLCARLEQAVGH